MIVISIKTTNAIKNNSSILHHYVLPFRFSRFFRPQAYKAVRTTVTSLWLFKQIHPQPIASLPENIFTDDRVLLH